MDDQKRQEIFVTVQQYRDMAGRFAAIAQGIQEAIRANDVYGIALIESNDNSVKLRVFDNPVELSFSFLIGESKTVLGKITCERITQGDNREHITLFYFDRQGLMNDQGPQQYICDLVNRYLGDRFLMYLLDKYIALPCFRIDGKLSA